MLPARRAALLRQKRDEALERAADCAAERRAVGVVNSWLRATGDRHACRTVRRDTDDVLMQQGFSVQERRERLRDLLDDEERQLVSAARRERETAAQMQAQMRQRAKSLQDARETQRRQMVAQKLDQQFREQCQELREAQSKRRLLQVCEERGAQLRSQQEGARRQRREDDAFHRLWQADARAKEDRERREAADARRCGQMQMDFLCRQMADAESQRQRERRRRQEEARRQEQEMQDLQQQAQRQRRLEQEAQVARRRSLDDSLRLKMERVAKEQQDELQMDLRILQQMLQDESQAQQETADKRADRRDEQLRFRQYLAEQMMKRKKDEERMEQMMAEKMKETWDRRERQNLLQQDARKRLMNEVTESRRLQTAQKQQRDFQRRADVARERAEQDAAVRDMKRADRELSKRQRQAYLAYQAELRAQMEQRQRLRREQEEQELGMQRQLERLQQEKLQKKDQVLARPNDGVSHPFRSAREPSSFPTQNGQETGCKRATLTF
ncbi:cilia- and flagella-associated protein 53 [Syngnathoides biaculeatus]|uniref:cilia- and flagella-associated protein 53 n=1 Tax=Syngnathoides biaculeatus TaxID=300417 RepID=UPI002ADDBE52|nr:cilia- and flagella-associated protein 53 [Syngnathoides biaculeatus]XP_061657148.1 cilia- and flagella-associated protein 53 [Syngnathoides biaculeatus]XP_061657149.1 cilia- and flagella-associated protein 53 [Syngnathoides biaculeatus]